MEVIFIKDLKGQGKKDDLKNVSDGYAMNYLIPNGYAVKATPGKIESLKTKLKIQKEEDSLGQAETLQLKKVIETIQPVFKLSFSNEDKAKGSVTSQELVQKLKDEFRIELSTKQFKNYKNLNKLGTSEVYLNLGYGIKATLKVKIERK